jgi:DNA-binding transcriptional ArsR family regulator
MSLHPTTDQLDAIFSALANTKRRGMITTLAFRPATVGQLAEEYILSLPAIHKHIRVLEDADLIQRKKVGRTNFVAIKRQGLLAAQSWLGEFKAYWGSDKETLENYIHHLESN